MLTKPTCIESTLDWRVLGYNVRFWIERKELPTGDEPFKDEKALIERLREIPIKHPKFRPNGTKEVAEKVIELFPTWFPELQLNAIQVKQSDMGVMIYLVPFDNEQTS